MEIEILGPFVITTGSMNSVSIPDLADPAGIARYMVTVDPAGGGLIISCGRAGAEIVATRDGETLRVTTRVK